MWRRLSFILPECSVPYLSIIMPAFNEGDHIYGNIAMTRRVMEAAGLDTEIVAVDDGSTDGTRAEIDRAAGDFTNVVSARNPYNMGKGMALRTGFDYSSGDVVVFLDADLDLHPSQIQALIGILEEAPWDVIVTSKHHPDSRLDYPWFRKVASWGYYMIIKLMFGLPVRDTQTGLKVFRRKVLETVFHRLLVKKFAYDVELLATAVRFGFKVHELPVVLDFKRSLSWGRIRFGDIMRIFIDTLAVFYRLRILRYYDTERPPVSRGDTPVLVVVRGCPPPVDVMERLSVDTTTSIACISRDLGSFQADTMFFGDEQAFERWMENNAGSYSIVGFLGPDCLPMGSWVKNAVRNFAMPDVTAVCGPLIPGPVETVRGQAAGLVLSSLLTAGPERHLHTIARIRSVTKARADNVFFRASLYSKPPGERPLRFENGSMTFDGENDGRIRYDPDVAVSKPVPVLFAPYLSHAASDAFARGGRHASGRGSGLSFRNVVSVAVFVFLAAGWTFLPGGWYRGIAAAYGVSALLSGFAGLGMKTAPLAAAGIVLEHVVRGCAFPAGVAAGLARRFTR